MPRDRLAAMQKSAYMEDGDEFIPFDEDPEGPLREYFKADIEAMFKDV